jgi:hypothetical protein
MSGRRKAIVGLFAEGSRLTDPKRDWFDKLWQALADHCEHPVELKVFGISKSQIVRLCPERLPVQKGATKLIQEKGKTQIGGGAEPLDVLVARTVARESLDRVVVAFDSWPANQLLTDTESRHPCAFRAEIAFLLKCFTKSTVLPHMLRVAACELLERYDTDGDLAPRVAASQPLEIILMEPMFEALLVSDEQTVRKALGFRTVPKDWPKFRTKERALDKRVLDPAVECKEKRAHQYLAAKSWWGYKIVSAADHGAKLWHHVIARRLCRILAG